MPLVLREEDSRTPRRDRQDTAHKGVWAVADSDRATIMPSAVVARQLSNARKSAPNLSRKAPRTAVVTTSRARSIMANCMAQQAAAFTGRVWSMPGTGRPRER